MVKKFFISILFFSIINVSQIDLLFAGKPEVNDSVKVALRQSSSRKPWVCLAAVVGLGIYGAYKGVANYLTLKEIETEFVKSPSVINLDKGDLANWNVASSSGVLSLPTAHDVCQSPMTKGVLSTSIKSVKDIDNLILNVENQKTRLRGALLYLWDCSEIPQKFFNYCKETEFKEEYAQLPFSDKDSNHPLDILCNFPDFLQTWKLWDEEVSKVKKIITGDGLKKSAIGDFFNRNILYTPSVYVWRWKMMPFASKAEELFFKLLKKYTRLCALYTIFNTIVQDIKEEKYDAQNQAVVNVNVNRKPDIQKNKETLESKMTEDNLKLRRKKELPAEKKEEEEMLKEEGSTKSFDNPRISEPTTREKETQKNIASAKSLGLEVLQKLSELEEKRKEKSS